MLCGRNQSGMGFENPWLLTGTLSKCFRLHSRKQSFVGGLIRDMGKLCYRLVDSKEAA